MALAAVKHSISKAQPHDSYLAQPALLMTPTSVTHGHLPLKIGYSKTPWHLASPMLVP
jgi:hypothetical protein